MDTGEKAILKLHPHILGYLGFYFLGIFIVVIGVMYFWQAIPIGMLVFVMGEVFRRATTFYVLESGVALGYHLFSTSRKFAEYGNIQNLEVSQSFLENILGIGSISFDTSGSNHIEVHFNGVANPYRIERMVREKMSQK